MDSWDQGINEKQLKMRIADLEQQLDDALHRLQAGDENQAEIPAVILERDKLKQQLAEAQAENKRVTAELDRAITTVRKLRNDQAAQPLPEGANEPAKPMEIGAIVWRLCMNSAVQGPTDKNGIGPYLRNGEFVELDEYESLLKKFLTLSEQLTEAQAEVERLKLDNYALAFPQNSEDAHFKAGMERAAEIVMLAYRDITPDSDASYMDICMAAAQAIRAEIDK